MNIAILDTECVDALDEHEAWLLSQQGRCPDGDAAIDLDKLEACRRQNPQPARPMKRIVATSVMKLSAASPYSPLSFVDFLTFDGEKMGEAELVRATFDALGYAAPDGLVVTFNGLRHDLPLLAVRAMKHRISLPPGLDLVREGAPHDARNVDLMQRFTRNKISDWARMSGYAAALDIPAKMVSAPASIHQLVEDGKWPGVRDHVESDVVTTALLYARWRNLQPGAASSLRDEATIVDGVLSGRQHRAYAPVLARWRDRCLTGVESASIWPQLAAA